MVVMIAFLGSCVAERTSIPFPRISGALRVRYDARTVGTLSLGDDGCLYLRSAETTGPTEELLLWPASYEPQVDGAVSIVGEGGAVVVAGGTDGAGMLAPPGSRP